MKKAIKVNTQTIIGVPKQWVRPSTPEHTTLDYHTLPDAEHFADGWKQVVTPVYNSSIEKLGELVEYPDRFEYSVQPLTDEEIQNNAISNDNSEKENLIQDKMRIDAEAALIQEVEAIPIDDAEAMQESIPLQKWWTEGETVVGSVLSNNPFDIRKDFDADNIIRLWKCKQGHTTQSDYRPKDTQALWEMIPFPGEYFKYNPMTLYSEGDIVWFPEVGDTLYRSKIDNNSWSPTGYPQGLEVYNP